MSVDLIENLSLYSSVFHIPDNMSIKLSGTPASPMSALRAAAILHALVNPSVTTSTLSGQTVPTLPAVHPLLLSELPSPTNPLRRLFLAAALTPYHGLTYTQAKGKVRPASEAVLRDGLKLGAQHHYLDGIPALFTAADLLRKGVEDWVNGQMDKPERAWIGVLLRERNVHNPVSGSMWASSLLFALVQELTEVWAGEAVSIDGGILSLRRVNTPRMLMPDVTVEAASSRIAAYNKFVARVEELGLPAAVDAKPILDVRSL